MAFVNFQLAYAIREKLSEIREGYYFFFAGVYDDGTAELIVTTDGEIINIPLVEDLVAAAPELKGWTFMASKPEPDPNYTTIELQGYPFSLENQHFYATESPDFPDSIR